ncbi:NAD(P)H-dependent glycerol-3-phosphate dehydrogenase [Thermoproteota archaeon]
MKTNGIKTDSSAIKNIGIIGCGAWGVTIAKLLAENGKHVSIWCHDKQIAEQINSKKTHPNLPGVILPDKIIAETEFNPVISASELLVSALASPYISQLIHIKPFYKTVPVLSLTKGFMENEKSLFISDYIKKILDNCPLAILSGPNLAEEIASGLPAASVIASDQPEIAALFQKQLSSVKFRVYTSRDVAGVELGGILKNIIAIASGGIDGLNLGSNLKSALMTRGIKEMIRFAEYYNAKQGTLYGLSGIGDLITTCSSPKSRNYTVGYELAKGNHLPQILSKLGVVAEGVKTTKIVYHIARSNQISMPITEQIYNVLYESKPVLKALEELMLRDLRSEL